MLKKQQNLDSKDHVIALCDRAYALLSGAWVQDMYFNQPHKRRWIALYLFVLLAITFLTPYSFMGIWLLSTTVLQILSYRKRTRNFSKIFDILSDYAYFALAFIDGRFWGTLLTAPWIIRPINDDAHAEVVSWSFFHHQKSRKIKDLLSVTYPYKMARNIFTYAMLLVVCTGIAVSANATSPLTGLAITLTIAPVIFQTLAYCVKHTFKNPQNIMPPSLLQDFNQGRSISYAVSALIMSLWDGSWMQYLLGQKSGMQNILLGLLISVSSAALLIGTPFIILTFFGMQLVISGFDLLSKTYPHSIEFGIIAHFLKGLQAFYDGRWVLVFTAFEEDKDAFKWHIPLILTVLLTLTSYSSIIGMISPITFALGLITIVSGYLRCRLLVNSSLSEHHVEGKKDIDLEPTVNEVMSAQYAFRKILQSAYMLVSGQFAFLNNQERYRIIQFASAVVLGSIAFLATSPSTIFITAWFAILAISSALSLKGSSNIFKPLEYLAFGIYSLMTGSWMKLFHPSLNIWIRNKDDLRLNSQQHGFDVKAAALNTENNNQIAIHTSLIGFFSTYGFFLGLLNPYIYAATMLAIAPIFLKAVLQLSFNPSVGQGIYQLVNFSLKLDRENNTPSVQITARAVLSIVSGTWPHYFFNITHPLITLSLGGSLVLLVLTPISPPVAAIALVFGTSAIMSTLAKKAATFRDVFFVTFFSHTFIAINNILSGQWIFDLFAFERNQKELAGNAFYIGALSLLITTSCAALQMISLPVFITAVIIAFPIMLQGLAHAHAPIAYEYINQKEEKNDACKIPESDLPDEEIYLIKRPKR
ncbi:MAG: hypothetical protein FJ161_01720 [Gammaproteobacteria bacterium]|nr:hypothetical protein [Gammaproteobacteria bacterium]